MEAKTARQSARERGCLGVGVLYTNRSLSVRSIYPTLAFT